MAKESNADKGTKDVDDMEIEKLVEALEVDGH